jgi:hypothetical protein
MSEIQDNNAIIVFNGSVPEGSAPLDPSTWLVIMLELADDRPRDHGWLLDPRSRYGRLRRRFDQPAKLREFFHWRMQSQTGTMRLAASTGASPVLVMDTAGRKYNGHVELPDSADILQGRFVLFVHGVPASTRAGLALFVTEQSISGLATAVESARRQDEHEDDWVHRLFMTAFQLREADVRVAQFLSALPDIEGEPKSCRLVPP